MNKENVLKIVDSCFHEYASYFRTDAQNKASELYDKLSKQQESTEQSEQYETKALHIADCM